MMATGDSVEAGQSKLGHRRVGRDGRTSFKKVESQQLTSAVQVGISRSMESTANTPDRDLLMQDFMTQETISLATVTAHEYKFKVYGPNSFRHFRRLFSVSEDDFQRSLCQLPIKELSNPGASGSMFFISGDDKYIIKTVQQKEAEFLQKLLPGYYLNLHQNTKTMLPKFMGLYCYQTRRKNIRLLVMNNIIPNQVTIDLKYDLKGSTHGRAANQQEKLKPQPTFKDLDFLKHYPNGIYLEPDVYFQLVQTLERDCRVLESFGIMDYSLLLAIHKIQPNQACEGGIDGDDRKGHPLRLFIGVIDVLQSYRLIKKVEKTLKSVLYDANSISVNHPKFYTSRFLKFIKNHVFVTKKLTPFTRPVFAGDTASCSSGFGSVSLYRGSVDESARPSITDSSDSED